MKRIERRSFLSAVLGMFFAVSLVARRQRQTCP